MCLSVPVFPPLHANAILPLQLCARPCVSTVDGVPARTSASVLMVSTAPSVRTVTPDTKHVTRVDVES